MVVRLVQWVFFSVLLSLIPLVVNVIKVHKFGLPSGMVRIDESALSVFELMAYKGDVLLLAVGLSAAGIGDLISSGLGPSWMIAFKLALGGVCLANLIAACLLYPFIEQVYRAFGSE